MKMNRIVVLLLACTVPVFFFLQVLQAYQFLNLEKQVQLLEAEQKEWVEQNKKLIAGISVMSTPERIDAIAQDELGLEKIDSSEIVRVKPE
ncbi:MAG: cell division protein FtsL [Spirochaetales bacterium]|nr:cell division protein FtsL [Spirochaetales bacterium]